MPSTSQTCFLLNYSYRDVADRFHITLYAKTAENQTAKIIIDNFRPLFFVPSTTPDGVTKSAAERKPMPLKSLRDKIPVDCLYFATYDAFNGCQELLRKSGATVYESDVNPVDRYLMERFVCGGFDAVGDWGQRGPALVCVNPRIRGAAASPSLSALSLDIETDAGTNEILSIAGSGKTDAVFVTGDHPAGNQITFCRDEKTLLQRFYSYVKSEDPDILIGWNVVEFDLKLLQERSNRHKIPFDLGRDAGSRITPSRLDGHMVARIPGRVVFDIPVLLRTYYHTFEEYSLDFVAGEMLGKNKTITATGIDKIEEIKRLHREDPATLARYNLTDAVLTKEIFDKAGILPNAIERTKRSGHLLDRSGGSVAAFDYLYLPRLHRAGYVANNAADVAGPDEPLPGGHVLEPTPGIYENVLVFDFRSLYPSIIMTFNIDPLGLHVPTENAVKGPVGPPFAKEGSILPSIIAELMEARAKAKQDNNPYLSYAIKILMNSFYGVLGAAGCRFFNSDLAATITQTGQFILKETIHHIQTVANVPVIYGDTDSLFVLLGPGSEKDAAGRGSDLAAEITEWLSRMVKERFHVDSALTLQFENHFRYFFMPALRGSTQGSKKHYCGAIVDDSGMKLSFKGMESARSDWTELAKETQYALIMRVFSKQPVEEYLLDVTSKLRSGKLDGKLVYKKRLRKPVSDYTVNVPPHVQAAKLCKTPPHMVRYVMTINGPQPVENLTAPIDYDHYIEAQLKPVADSILEWTGTGFDAIVLGQQDLFA